jgi:polyisoprenoid-binding protein YceI
MTKCLLKTLALIGFFGTTAHGQGTVRLAVGGDSRLWIEGSSNVSGWTCMATAVDAAIDVDVGFREAADFPKYLRSVRVKVPVTALKCGHDQMDNSLRKALRADDSTNVAYIVATFDAVKAGVTDSFTVQTVGTLILAGHENTVKMDVRATRSHDDALEAQGELPILMSDYGIRPPTGMFGVIRARNRVVVKFALTLAPETIAAVAERCAGRAAGTVGSP